MASILERHKNAKIPAKKTREDYAEDALYREVWEDVNNEKTTAFVKKYYKPIIVAAVAIVIVVASFVLYRGISNHNRITTAGVYETAIGALDANALAGMAQNNSGAMADLALFQAYILGGDSANLERLVDRGATRDFRDLARIHLASMNGDMMSAVAFEKFMDSLDTKKSPYYFTARLMVAQKFLAENDIGNADKILNKIINDKDAPAMIVAAAQTLK